VIAGQADMAGYSEEDHLSGIYIRKKHSGPK
jgi:hypothetical protein